MTFSIPMVLFLLIAAHFIGDYVLQSPVMAVEKSRHSTSDLQKAVPWYYWLTAHALTHGVLVALITQSVFLGICETLAHWSTDRQKCDGNINLRTDQYTHLFCKGVWFVLYIAMRW